MTTSTTRPDRRTDRVYVAGPAKRPERAVAHPMTVESVVLTPAYTIRVSVAGEGGELWLTLDWPAAKALRDALDARLPEMHRYAAAEDRPVTCTCGYEAASMDDLDDHAVTMARVDDQPHREDIRR